MSRPWPALYLFGPAILYAVVATVGALTTATDETAWAKVERAPDDVVGSEQCARCHEDEYRSWHRTYHRTMTQEAKGDAVLAPFAGEQVDYAGFRATMSRDEDGAPRITVRAIDDAGETSANEPLLDVPIELAIGSHRFQQYAARIDRGNGPGELWRLPMVWSVAERRWLHANGAFVEPEGQWGDPEAFERHLTRWNDNCLFCHNTQPSPGRRADGRFESHLGEIGIACEACHGPAGDHVVRHDNPFRRILAGEEQDGSITDPGRLTPARESAICGRCHGNRIGRDMEAILAHGDRFIAGDDLDEVSRPIYRDTTVPGARGLSSGKPFAVRFWPDGTPRLSAYEYQGLLMSPCYGEGEPGDLGCNHCHDMHGEEPAAQPRAGRQGDAACTDCHATAELGGADRPGGHGGHGEVAPKVDCISCHMPRITYGLLEGLVTHRIDSPDPARWIGRHDMPDACTQCHVERSRSWAAESMVGLGLSGSKPATDALPEESVISRVALDLHGGDPLQRNLAADALARAGATGDLRMRAAWLVDGLEDDYPSVRWFAWRGLRDLTRQLEQTGELEAADVGAIEEALQGFDHLASIEQRVEISSRVRGILGPGALDADSELAEELHARGRDQEIWTGE